MRVANAQLQALWDRKRAEEGDSPRGFHAAADLGLRMQAVMIPWLEEQLAALDAEDERG